MVWPAIASVAAELSADTDARARLAESRAPLNPVQVVSFDQDGLFEGREISVSKPPIRLLERIEELRVLSSVSDAGLLSSAEEAGVFSKLEAAGAFSTAEKLLPLGAQPPTVGEHHFRALSERASQLTASHCVLSAALRLGRLAWLRARAASRSCNRTPPTRRATDPGS